MMIFAYRSILVSTALVNDSVATGPQKSHYVQVDFEDKEIVSKLGALLGKKFEGKTIMSVSYSKRTPTLTANEFLNAIKA